MSSITYKNWIFLCHSMTSYTHGKWPILCLPVLLSGLILYHPLLLKIWLYSWEKDLILNTISSMTHRKWPYSISSYTRKKWPHPGSSYVILCRPLLMENCLFLCHTMSFHNIQKAGISLEKNPTPISANDDVTCLRYFWYR